MKSIKPGRGPSMMGVVVGIVIAIFGLFFTVIAFRIGVLFIFPLFGIIFTIVAIVGVVYNYKNATDKNRMSLYDITDENEEPDPINKYIIYGKTEMEHSSNSYDADDHDRYCPYCGEPLKRDYEYCPKCGNQV